MKQLLYDISVACGKFLQVLCKEASWSCSLAV
jgi:hypothetical protein